MNKATQDIDARLAHPHSTPPLNDAAFLLSEMQRAERLHDGLLSCEAEIRRLDMKRAALVAEKPWLDADRSIALAVIDRDLADTQALHDETLAALLTP